MELSFKNSKLAKVLNSEREPPPCLRAGQRAADRAATPEHRGRGESPKSLSKLPQTRLHQLSGDRHGQLSVDVKHPYRLILVSDHEGTPRKPDGGLDWARITKVQVIEITDTH